MTMQFEDALLRALGKIADQIEVLSYGVENLTVATQEIAETLSKKEEHLIDKD